jgi:hypothetical protein
MSDDARATFGYVASRLFDADIQRATYKGALRLGVTVDLRQVRGWLEHTSYWTVTGPAENVRNFMASWEQYYRQVGDG